MRKILLADAYPELAAQLVDQSLCSTLSSSANRMVRWRCEKGHEWDALVSNRVHKGYGCPYCSGRLAIPGENDLATLYPELAQELVDPSLATQLKPTSHTRVDWRCPKGHVYNIAVSHRVAKKSGCPYCSGRKAIPGETDLATTHPELAAELVDKSLATSIKAGTNKKVEWRCSVCGETWMASPNSRVHMGSGCPHCAGKTVRRGGNDLMTLRPDLAKQVYDKELLPTLHITSNKVIMWECEHGHRWETSVGNRVQFGHGCPVCAAASHSSRMENEFSSAVEDLVGADVMSCNNRKVLSGKELDVFIPSANVAFEFDGVFWHSSDATGDADLGHVEKTRLCEDMGIRLVHVWEDTWLSQRSGVMAQVRDVLGLGLARSVGTTSFAEVVDRNVASDFVRSHSMYTADDFDRAFRVADDREDTIAMALVATRPDAVVITGYAGLSCFSSDVPGFLAFIADSLGARLGDLRVECDRSFDDGSVFQSAGLSKVDDIGPEILAVGESTGWARVKFDGDDLAKAGLRKAYTCGKTVWVVP